jgi:signal transduction histidine kinase
MGVLVKLKDIAHLAGSWLNCKAGPVRIGFIRASTKKMDGLINAILKLSREGLRPLSPEAVDLDVLLGRAKIAFRSCRRSARFRIVLRSV